MLAEVKLNGAQSWALPFCLHKQGISQQGPLITERAPFYNPCPVAVPDGENLQE